MARMPASIEAEARAAVGWLDRHIHPETAAAQATATATPTEGTTMTTPAAQPMASPFSFLHSLLSRVEHVGEDTLMVVEVILTNPEAATVLPVLGRLAGIPVTPGMISAAAGGLRQLVADIEAHQQPQQPDVTQLPPGQTAPAPSAEPSSDPRSR